MTTKQTKIVNSIEQAVKTLTQAKRDSAKPSKAVITLSIPEQVKLAREAGEAKGVELTQRAIFDKAAKALHDAKAVIGDLRKCKVAQAFIAGRYGNDKAVTAQTKKNALGAFRKAVETGKAYNENAARAEKAAAKKGAQTAPKADKAAAPADTKKATHVEASETATTYQCTIARKGSAAKAAQTLRDLVNKMKASEEYSGLCLALIDALNEFDGIDE
jgi:hypothetical protein